MTTPLDKGKDQLEVPAAESSSNTEAKRAKRRALLGAISGAGMIGAAKLPGQWARPVVDHVLLPAHAQASPCVFTCEIFGSASTSVASADGTYFISFTIIFTQACTRSPGGDSLSSSFSTSASSTSTTFPETYTETGLTTTSGNESFFSTTVGSFCSLPISDLFNQP